MRLKRNRLRRPSCNRLSQTCVPSISWPEVPDSSYFSQNRTIEEQQQQQVLDSVFAHPLTPCGRIEAPPLRYDPDMAIIISEEMGDAWTVKYRGLVGTSYDDMSVLEQKAPRWLLEFLLGNRTPFKEPAKVVRRFFCMSTSRAVLRSRLASPVLRHASLEGRRPAPCSSRAAKPVRTALLLSSRCDLT